MITDSEKAFIKAHAYLPEHIIEYGEAISGGEPYLFDSFLCYHHEGVLIFIGYPLEGVFEKGKARKIIDSVIKQFNAQQLAVIAPEDVFRDKASMEHTSDHYYRFDLMDFKIPSKVKNMINRSKKELVVREGRELTDEHRRLIKEFLESHRLKKEFQYIFEKIPLYIARSTTALILDGWDKKEELIAFDIVDFGAKDYVFYMFNVINKKHRVPGASDLLLHEIIERAKRSGYRFVNLGLGINRGVTFFKEKWGGKPFIPYAYSVYNLKPETHLNDLFQRL